MCRILLMTQEETETHNEIIESEPSPTRGVTWWMPAVLIVAATGVIVYLWFGTELMRQKRFLFSVAACIITSFAILFWLLFLSRISTAVRIKLLLALGVIAIIQPLIFRIEGVSGDLIPIVTWRWSPPPDRQLSKEIKSAPPPTIASLPGLRDYPQFLGPNRNAILSGVELSTDWNTAPPREVWRMKIGAGWSGFSVAGHRAITQEQRGDDEMVICYDIATGNELWAHADQTRYETTLGGVGPRSTPTIHDDRVYTLGATGLLNCVKLESGELVWSINILDDNNATMLEWGMSGSPLLVDGMVVINAGGQNGASLVAYDSRLGEKVWSAGNARASYSSPLIATFAGVRQIVILNQTSITGHDIESGTVLWSATWRGMHPKVAQPIPLPDDRYFVSASYGVGSALFDVSKDDAGVFSSSRQWKNARMKAKFTNLVYLNGFIYGLDDGRLVCLNVETGRRQWKAGSDGHYGHGQLILVGDILLIQAESGAVVLVSASSDNHQELYRFAALEEKTWNNPTLAGNYLLVRNHKTAACFELPSKGAE